MLIEARRSVIVLNDVFAAFARLARAKSEADAKSSR